MKQSKKKQKYRGKGFSAIELLASLVVIAVASGTAYGISMKCLDKVKKDSFNSAALTAVTWFESQYLMSLEPSFTNTGMYKVDQKFKEVCGHKGKKCIASSDSVGIDATSAITAAGLRTDDIENMKVIINTVSGRACVKIISKRNGSFHNKEENTIISGQCGYKFID